MKKSLFAICLMAVAANQTEAKNDKSKKVRGQGDAGDLVMQTEPSVMAQNAKFAKFAAKSNKSYSSKKEYKERKAIFDQQDKEVTALNKKWRGKTTFALNQFSDMTPEEKAALLPKMPETADKGKDFKKSMDKARGRKLQSVQDVDWRTEVRDQGRCGSCVAFATTTVMESARVAQGVTDPMGNQATLGQLSQQQLVSCGVANNHWYTFGCDGAWGTGYMDLFQQEGWMAYDDFAAYTSGYDNNTQAELCSAYYDPTKAVKQVSDFNCDVCEYGAEDNMVKTNEMIARLQNSPMYIGVDADAEFMAYDGGIMTSAMCPQSEVNHIVALVGYNQGTNGTASTTTTTEQTITYPAEGVAPDYINWTYLWVYCPADHNDYLTADYSPYYGYYNIQCWREAWSETVEVTTTEEGEPATDAYFIVQNSWGTRWGEDGFIRMAVEPGVGPCGLNQVWGWMDLNLTETYAA